MTKLPLVIFVFLGFFLARGQEGLPVYFDYLSDNYYLVYPSMAGIGEGGKARLTARKQWFDVEQAPNLQTLSVHSRVGDRSGLGAILFNDANGYHAQTGLRLTYAHHLKLGPDVRLLNQLSFGLSAGYLQSSLDETEFNAAFQDPLITGGRNSIGYFNVDLGMSYSYREFYSHVSVLNALGSGRDLYTAAEVDNLRRYLLSAGYVIDYGSWKLEPSFLLQLTEFTQEKTLDLNAKMYREVGFGTVFAGLSFRRSFDGASLGTDGGLQEQRLQLITPLLGVNYKRFLFAYNYSYQSGDLRVDDGGFHQLTIGLDFGKQGRDRFDCFCPAANY